MALVKDYVDTLGFHFRIVLLKVMSSWACVFVAILAIVILYRYVKSPLRRVPQCLCAAGVFLIVVLHLAIYIEYIIWLYNEFAWCEYCRHWKKNDVHYWSDLHVRRLCAKCFISH